MEDEARQIERRDRLRRAEAMRLMPEERLARMEALTQEGFALLRQSPEGLERFWRRNLKKRAVRGDASWLT